MKQIKSYIAVSLDGFIAPPDKELDWIPQEVKFLLNKEYEMADNLLMGANTYLYLFKHWGGWPYKSQRSFVVSHYHNNVTRNYNVEFLLDNPFLKIDELMENPLKVVPLIHSNLTPVKFSHSPFCLFLFSSYSSCPLCRVLH